MAELKISHPVSDGEPRDYEVVVSAGEAGEAHDVMDAWDG